MGLSSSSHVSSNSKTQRASATGPPTEDQFWRKLFVFRHFVFLLRLPWLRPLSFSLASFPRPSRRGERNGEREKNELCLLSTPTKKSKDNRPECSNQESEAQKKTFMRALEEGVLNATSGASVNIIVMLVNRTPGYVTASVMQAVDKAQTELKT